MIALAAGLLVVAACTPRVQGLGVLNRAPELSDQAAVAPDGGRLPLDVWPAEGGTRAVAIALHGFNDYRRMYAAPGIWWASRGITTYAYDQRGFGNTEQRGIWAGVDTLVHDLGTMVRLVRERHPGVPVYLVGHSMGGAVVMAAMARPDAPEVDGVALAAPAVWGGSTLSPIYRGLLWLVAHVAPGAKPTGRNLGIQASDNIEMLRGLGRDPLVIKRTRWDAVYGLVQLMDAALASAPAIRVPMLFLYGERDQLIRKPSVETALSGVTGPRRMVVYPDGWHMLFRDLGSEAVWRDVAGWMLDPAAPFPSGFERDRLPLFPDD